MSETFLSRVSRSNDESIYFICGKHKGLWAWYYVRIDRLKQSLFERSMATGSFDIAAFGQVLASGYGNEPPEHIRNQFEPENA